MVFNRKTTSPVLVCLIILQSQFVYNNSANIIARIMAKLTFLQEKVHEVDGNGYMRFGTVCVYRQTIVNEPKQVGSITITIPTKKIVKRCGSVKKDENSIVQR